MTNPILELKSVSKRFGHTTAVSCVDLTVEEGEFITLLGASGSGKSTILMLIAGFLEANEGDIALRGLSLRGEPPHHRRIGMVFQNYALFPHLSVYENIAFGLRNFGWNRKAIRHRVDEMLELVHLPELASRLPSQISGGQQQRVSLARALAFQPDLLLLDEPIGALDRSLREAMLEEFRRIHRVVGTTMIFVTHDQQEALVMSDRVAVLDKGRLVRIDTPQGLFEDPRSTFVGSFLGEMNFLTAQVQDSGHARMNGGGFAIALPAMVSPGHSIVVGIRPEKIVLGPVPEDWNRMGGQIEELFYLGEATKFRVRIDPEVCVMVKQVNRQASQRYTIGDRVELGWHPSDGQVLEEDRQAPGVAEVLT